jgi:protein-disulfide isomerase
MISTLKPPVSERDHVQGPARALLELVEYGDFECPHCGRAAVAVSQLQAELGDQMRFVFRHFPLAKMHPHARKAAQAAEAAGAQNRFWEMHNRLFKGAPALAQEDLLRYADELGLDLARFESELAGDVYATRVQEDVSSGVRSGVNGTPTFFINGVRHNSGYSLEELRDGLGVGGV